MKNEDINARIYDLLNQKNYSLLTSEDKLFLLSHNISEEKFNHLVKTEIYLNERFVEFEDDTADEIILDNLIRSVLKQKRKNVILMKLPAYYTIAASLLVFLFSWTLFTNMNESRVSYKEKLIYDTIYISSHSDKGESPINMDISKQDKLNKNINNSNTKRNFIKNVAVEEFQHTELPTNEFVGLANVKFVTNQSKGINQNDDSIVSKMRFTMQRDKIYVLNNQGN